MTADAELLRRYATERSEAAFAELVHRHLDFVYAAALRQAQGNTALVEDAVQSVFTDLARHAARLSRHVVIVGWLHAATRFAVAKAIRSEVRRRAREEKAHHMNEALREHTVPADWTQLQPVLDDVLAELKERERVAVLLKFFEKRSFAEIGSSLRLTETAARSCLDRALEKMHQRLARRGLNSSAGALGLVLANQLGATAPAGLATSVAAGALAATAVGSAVGGMALTQGAIYFMAKSKILLVGALAVVGAIVATRQFRDHPVTAAPLPPPVTAQPIPPVASLPATSKVVAAESATTPQVPAPATGREAAKATASGGGEWRGNTEQLIASTVSQALDQSCNEFFARNPVDAATRKKAIDVLTNETLAGMDIAELSQRPGGLTPEAISQLLAVGRAKTAEQLKEILGVEKGTAFLEFIAAREAQAGARK